MEDTKILTNPLIKQKWRTPKYSQMETLVGISTFSDASRANHCEMALEESPLQLNNGGINDNKVDSNSFPVLVHI